MRKIQLLDCTLRDGGCVINFNFGLDYMRSILGSLEASGIDIIECGYIDGKKGSETGRTEYINEKVITDNFLVDKKLGTTYVAMIDYGKFDANLLAERTQVSIDGIRLAFHKKDRMEAVEMAKAILIKGYKVFIQPMTIMRYSDGELLSFVELLNRELPQMEAFYIVDSFGEMRLNDMKRIAYLVDHNLKMGVTLGLHSHNNLQLSYSNAVTLLDFPTDRDLIFDVSIMGMGKGAGNLNTELFAEHLNLYYGKRYGISPLLEVIDRVINQIKEEYHWGYSIEYYLSSRHHCTPSYAGYFYKKHILTVDQIDELLGMIDENRKISFDVDYAEQIYKTYNEKQYDDVRSLEILSSAVKDKKALILAPGSSIAHSRELIMEKMKEEGTISIALNHYKLFPTDYVFITKKVLWEELPQDRTGVITTSNVCSTPGNSMIIFDYLKWGSFQGKRNDMSIVALMNILIEAGVSEVLLAGFDGFSVDITRNYYDESLKRPVTIEQAQERNSFMSAFLGVVKEKVKVTFLTRSEYEG